MTLIALQVVLFGFIVWHSNWDSFVKFITFWTKNDTFWKQEKKVKKGYFSDFATLFFLEIFWSAAIIFLFFWLPTEIKNPKEYTTLEILVRSTYEEVILRIMPALLLAGILKWIKRYRNIPTKDKHELDLSLGVMTSIIFGMAHIFKFTNPILAIPLCLSQTLSGFTFWYLQRRYGYGASVMPHIAWNLMLQI